MCMTHIHTYICTSLCIQALLELNCKGRIDQIDYTLLWMLEKSVDTLCCVGLLGYVFCIYWEAAKGSI